jgi:hypothetical protein
MNMIELSITNVVLAGMSLTTTYWLALVTVLTGWMCWDHRDRFVMWRHLGSDEKADATLNWGMLLIFLYSTAQRGYATYTYAVADWTPDAVGLDPLGTLIVPIYLPVALVGLALLLWWKSFHRFREKHRWWWCMWMWTGLGMFAAVVLLVEPK